ncbi:MAG: monooxygenase, partial [Acidimicrobiales bacterium]|nr:monooxygenase [Acidimicrobiales bacterium]
DATGVWVAGQHHELDCLIFASGFEFATDFTHRCGYETTGRDGRTLADHWADGMRTFHGLQVHGFPNLFISGISQNASLISNVTSNLTDAADTIAAVVGHAHARGDATVEPTAEAEQAWVDRIATGGARGPFANPDCTPGYYNNEGRPEDLRARMGGGDPGGPLAYFAHIEAWRTSGDFEGVAFT